MNAAIEQVKRLVSSVALPDRQSLILTLTKIIHLLEEPEDMLQRIGGSHLQSASVIIGFDLGLFKLIDGAPSSVTLDELTEKTGADKVLLGRLLRYIASIGLIEETGIDEFNGNHATKNLTTKVGEAGMKHYFYTVCPEYQSLPAHLKKSGYKNPQDETHTSWHDGHNTDDHPFVWFGKHPEHMAYFNDFMATRRHSELSWLTVYPVKEAAANWPADKPLLVNVGGNIGHQCAEFKQKYPDVPGRVVLQDLQHSIDAALPTPGVENLVHNFFESQPIKGSKFYHLRGVFHNHPDHKVELILKHIKDAMTPESVLLVDEIIVPAKGVNLEAAAHDITMAAAFAGAERPETYWNAMFEKVGLKLFKAYVYNAPSYETVLDVRLA